MGNPLILVSAIASHQRDRAVTERDHTITECDRAIALRDRHAQLAS